MNNDVAFLLKFIEAGIRVLSSRVLLIATLLLTFSLFAWEMFDPSPWRLGAATIFAAIVFLPILSLDKAGGFHNVQTEAE